MLPYLDAPFENPRKESYERGGRGGETLHNPENPHFVFLLQIGSPCERYRDSKLLQKQYTGTVVLQLLVFRL